jgi:hypothetical protein
VQPNGVGHFYLLKNPADGYRSRRGYRSVAARSRSP